MRVRALLGDRPHRHAGARAVRARTRDGADRRSHRQRAVARTESGVSAQAVSTSDAVEGPQRGSERMKKKLPLANAAASQKGLAAKPVKGASKPEFPTR